jgi:hypothetical protein
MLYGKALAGLIHCEAHITSLGWKVNIESGYD